jgi:hypothetical protein
LDTVQAQFLSDAWALVDFQTGLAFAAEKLWIEVHGRDVAPTNAGVATV